MATAEAKVDAAFEFFTKLGVPHWCFHDIDLAPDAEDIGEYEKNLKHMVGLAKARQEATGTKLLWGTANLFSHPRYMNGASTNPDFHVLAHGGAQVKAALDATIALDGENYVLVNDPARNPNYEMMLYEKYDESDNHSHWDDFYNFRR